MSKVWDDYLDSVEKQFEEAIKNKDLLCFNDIALRYARVMKLDWSDLKQIVEPLDWLSKDDKNKILLNFN